LEDQDTWEREVETLHRLAEGNMEGFGEEIDNQKSPIELHRAVTVTMEPSKSYFNGAAQG
jgi:hypothetical protein